VKDNETITQDLLLELPEDTPISQPYWIAQTPEDNLFTIQDQVAIGKPFNEPAVAGELVLEIEGLSISKTLPLKYKYNDPVDGEINQLFTVVPEIRLSVNTENVFVLNGQAELVEVQVSFEDMVVEGELVFDGLSAG